MTVRDPSSANAAPVRPPLRLLPVSLVTIAALALAAPWITSAALGVLGVEATTPMEWVPATFPPRKAYEQFTQEFESGDVVIASWDGCTLDAPALDSFIEAANGPAAPTDKQGRAWFEPIASGRNAIARLTEPPLSLEPSLAIERLKGVLIGADGTTTCLFIPCTRAGLTDRRRSVAWIRATLQRVAGVAPENLHLAGPVIDNISVDDASLESFRLFAAPVALMILGLTWWSLRSLAYALLVFLVSLACVGLSFWFLSAWGDRMNPVLIVMPVLVLTLGVSGGIHLVNYLIDSLATGSRQGVAARAIRLGWLPCTLSAGTTAIGLASLVVSELEPIRVFGFHAAFGVMATLVVLFLVIPGIFERWPIRVASASETSAAARWEDWFAALFVRHAGPIVMVSSAAMLAAILGVPNIRTSVGIDTLFQPGSRVIDDYAWLEKAIGPLVPVEVVLRFPTDSAVRPAERLELVQEVGAELATMPGISGVISAATFLPDLPEFSGVRGRALKSVVARKLEQSLSGLADMRIVRDLPEAQLWRVTGRITALSGTDFGEFLARVRKSIDPIVERHGGATRGVFADYTGVMPLINAIQKALLHDLFTSFLSACVLITLIMMLVERGVLAGLVAMVPNVFPMILLFGLIGWTGTALDIGSVMTASIALGMAIDGTLHFLTFFRRGLNAATTGTPRERRIFAVHSAFRHSAAALSESSIVCGLGILVFAGSSFAPTSRFAWMLALLVAAALVGDLVLLPALLTGRAGLAFKPYRLQPNRPAPPASQ